MTIYADTNLSGDLLGRAEPLEKAAATLVGMLLFAFSRVDLHVGQALDAPLAALPFEQKLDAFESQVNAGDATADVREGWLGWTGRARESRPVWTELAGGRW